MIKTNALKIGWGEATIIILFIFFAVWGYIKKESLENNDVYVKGIITGTNTGSRGSNYLDFEFYLDEKKIISSVPLSWCKECKAGDTIIVKFDRTNPNNNTFLKKLPKGKKLLNQ